MLREFTNDIYPRSLWVATKDDLPAIISAFAPVDSAAEWSIEAFDGKEAASVPVYHKKTEKLGYLVVLNRCPKTPVCKLAAHEASHCAIWCCGDLDVALSGDAQEAFAYLVGYYTECIMQVLDKLKIGD